MENIAKCIVRHRNKILILAIALLIPSIFGYLNTKINYDILSYLPKEAESMKGQEVLDKDFNLASVGMMVTNDLSDKEVVSLKDKIEKIEDGDAKQTQEFESVKFVASVDRYYTTLFFAKQGGIPVAIDASGDKKPAPYIYANGDLELYGYIGPKDYKFLDSINGDLTYVIEYGIITFFAKPIFLLLEFLHSHIGNWGWAIIVLTIIVKLILYPLSYKGMVSMQKIKEITPKMKELQEKYKSDPQKLQMHMMQLYKKHGANPLGGCLPLLIQIPIFYAIYRVLYNSVELKSADFIFWIHDLSAMDPFFVLPILMGVSMYVQQRLTPSGFSDPTQEKIFRMLPVFFTIFLVFFPAGLVLYWTVNNLLTILQQLSINAMLERKKQREIAEHKKPSEKMKD